MNEDVTAITEVVDSHQGRWKSLGDGIIEGIFQGVKEGVTEGLKTGVKDGIKDCVTKGLVNLEDTNVGDIEDILKDIPAEILRNIVKAKARDLFVKSTEDYFNELLQKLRSETEERGIHLTTEQVRSLFILIQKNRQVVMDNVVSRLSGNPFLEDIVCGLLEALEEGFEEQLKSCEGQFTKEMVEDSQN